jgi:hypothetical protein
MNELPSVIDTGTMGGLDAGEHVNFNGDFQSVISAAGGISDINWLSYKRGKSFYIVHNSYDPIIPFDSGDANGVIPMCGGHRIRAKLVELGYDSTFEVLADYTNVVGLHVPTFGSAETQIWGRNLENGTSKLTYSEPVTRVTRSVDVYRPERVRTLILDSGVVVNLRKKLDVKNGIRAHIDSKIALRDDGKVVLDKEYSNVDSVNLLNVSIRNMINPMKSVKGLGKGYLLNLDIDSCMGNVDSLPSLLRNLVIKGSYDTVYPLRIVENFRVENWSFRYQMGVLSLDFNDSLILRCRDLRSRKIPTFDYGSISGLNSLKMSYRCLPNLNRFKSLVGNPFENNVRISSRNSSVLRLDSSMADIDTVIGLQSKEAFYAENFFVSSSSQAILRLKADGYYDTLWNSSNRGVYRPIVNPFMNGLDASRLFLNRDEQRTLYRISKIDGRLGIYKGDLGSVLKMDQVFMPLEAGAVYLPANSRTVVQYHKWNIGDVQVSERPLFPELRVDSSLMDTRISMTVKSGQDSSDCLLILSDLSGQDSALQMISDDFALTMKMQRSFARILKTGRRNFTGVPLLLHHAGMDTCAYFRVNSCLNCDSIYLRDIRDRQLALDSLIGREIRVSLVNGSGSRKSLGFIDRGIFTAVGNRIQRTQLGIYPNPASGFVKINRIDLTDESRFIIMDLTGRKVLELPTKRWQNEIEIDAMKWEAGMYQVRWGNSFGKFIVVK